MSKWFHDQEMGFAMGVCTAVPFLFCYLAAVLVPYVNEAVGMWQAFALGAGIAVFALACSFLFIALDFKAHEHEDRLSAPDVKVSAMGSNPE